MKTLTFLLFAFLVSCVVTLKNKEVAANKQIIKLEELVLVQDSLIQVIQKSNRIYLPIALKCNAKHK